ESVVRLLRTRGADDPEPVRQQMAIRERVERRHQLLRGQVAGRAEDDEDARVGPSAEPQPFEQRVCRDGCHVASVAALTACPPNWLRSAAFTFAANDSS